MFEIVNARTLARVPSNKLTAEQGSGELIIHVQSLIADYLPANVLKMILDYGNMEDP